MANEFQNYEKKCSDMGLSLYQPRNGSTYNSVKNWIQQNSNIIVPNFLWLGIELDNANIGSYLSDGTHITVDDWLSGQPNNNKDNCVAMAKANEFRWIDTSCSRSGSTSTIGAICASPEGKSNFRSFRRGRIFFFLHM